MGNWFDLWPPKQRVVVSNPGLHLQIVYGTKKLHGEGKGLFLVRRVPVPSDS